MQFDEQQIQAINGGRAVIERGVGRYTIGGYAGTGKSTVAREICAGARVAVCAFMGKAADVLRTKGLPAETIHSTIYDYDSDTEEFFLKSSVDVDAFYVDEASMVSGELEDDLAWFGKPIIAAGDPGQLEPVNGVSRMFRDIDVTLETIHRSGDKIIDAASHVRLGDGSFPESICLPQTDFVLVVDEKLDLIKNGSCMIGCGFNKTKDFINMHVRTVLGHRGQLVPGERLMVLKNNRSKGVFNGQIIEYKGDGVFGVAGRDMLLNVVFCSKAPEKPSKRVVYVNYAYAATIHKLQGSEYDEMIIFDEQCEVWDQKKHRYTGLTRAKQDVVCLI